jgi:hypothetical protein
MTEVNIELQFKYLCNLAPKFSESNPVLSCFLDSTFDRVPVDIKLDEDDMNKEYRVTVSGKCKGEVPSDARLVFYATCVKLNQTKAPCRVDAGMAVIPLGSFEHGRFQGKVPLLLRTCKNFEKGALFVDARCPVQVGRPLIGAKERDGVMKQMADYINSVMHAEAKIPRLISGTKNIRVPIYYGDIGMLEKVPLPADAFLRFECPKSNVRFWDNALKTVLERDDMHIEDMKHMSLTNKARVFAEIQVYVTQYLDYIGDKVDENVRHYYAKSGTLIDARLEQTHYYRPSLCKGCERFGDALHDKCGDCEDLGLCIVMTFAAFRRCNFDKHPELRELQQRIGQHYIGIASLDVVTSGRVHARDVAKKKGAHINCIFVPTPYAKECMERGGSTLPFRPFPEEAHELPVLVGEGTGMYQVYGQHDTIHNERTFVYQKMDSLRFAKKPIVHEPGAPSSFFVGQLKGFTDYWFEQGVPVGGMWLGAVENGRFGIGADFVDMTRKRSNVAFRAHPPIPRAVMAHIEEGIKVRVPPAPLTLTAAMDHPKDDARLNKLVEFTQSLGRIPAHGIKPASIFVRPAHLTDQNIGNMIRDIRSIPEIYKVDYKLETMTDDLWGYKVDIYADVDE